MPIGNQDFTNLSIEQIETIPGMAHFAGTGPKDKYCENCAFLTSEKLKLFCRKYEELMGNRKYGLRGGLKSCKYFEEKSTWGAVASKALV